MNATYDWYHLQLIIDITLLPNGRKFFHTGGVKIKNNDVLKEPYDMVHIRYELSKKKLTVSATHEPPDLAARANR